MTDRVKVVKGLDCCIKQGEQGILDCDYDCPYGKHGNRLDCWIKMNRDALALLEEQEKEIAPGIDATGIGCYLRCGACTEKLPDNAKYCPHCGRKVK